jgi:hypothetical protein
MKLQCHFPKFFPLRSLPCRQLEINIPNVWYFYEYYLTTKICQEKNYGISHENSAGRKDHHEKGKGKERQGKNRGQINGELDSFPGDHLSILF